jgi:hypothetical protein
MRIVILLAGLAAAQNHTVYPIDVLPGDSSQVIPLGAFSFSSNFDETRSHFLIPGPYLPTTGGLLTAIQVAPLITQTGTLVYSSLTIRMENTTIPALSTTFANNLVNPTTVLAASNLTVSYPSHLAWASIPLQVPFLYDGRSNLVIEIQKVLDRANNPPALTASAILVNHPLRPDLPRPVWVFGGPGSGAWQAPTGSDAGDQHLMMRFQWRDQRTLTVKSTRQGNQDFFHLGATVTLDVHGQSGEVFVNTLDVNLQPSPVPTPPVMGFYWLPTFFNAFFLGVLDPSGLGTMSLVVPINQALVGTHMYFQSLTAGADFRWTNVVDGIIAP